MCHDGNASWNWLCEKAACKLALGKALSDKGCVVKLIIVRQGKKNMLITQRIVRKTAGLLSTTAAHKYIPTKAMK